MKKAHYIAAVFLLCFYVHVKSQNVLNSFQWSDHLPYNLASSVTHQGNVIYAVSNECLFSYNKNDNSYQRYNKVNGLSDIEPAQVKNNPYNNAMLVIYKNSNIDVLKGGGVTNVPDLLNKQNIGNKTVNSITFSGKFAYLACGFGIAVFDTDALQFADNYIIGPNGSSLNVYQVALSSTYIFAATSKGIYKAPLSASNLSSFTNWTHDTTIPNPNAIFNGIVNFGGNILANYSYYLTTNTSLPYGGSQKDTLYKLNSNGSGWNKNTFNTTDQVVKILVSDDSKQFIVLESLGFSAYNLSGTNIMGGQWENTRPNTFTAPGDVMPDPTEAGTYWQADLKSGLLKLKKPGATIQITPYQINGPASAGCAQIQWKDDKLLIAPDFLGYQQTNAYGQDAISTYSNGTWVHDTVSTSNNAVFDVNCVAFDYNDKNHFYGGSFGTGLVEIKNDVMVAQYTGTNSPIPGRTLFGSSNNQYQVTSLFTDPSNNLWITTNDGYNFLTVKKNDNSWENLDFSSIVSGLTGLYTNQVLVDSFNQTWVAAYGVGIFLYKNDGKFSQPNASNSILLINKAGKGNLPSNYPICMAYDKSGDMWIGTDQGIYVFYNPSSILTQTSGWDAQPIYVQQDGQTQLLLQTDNVTSICVDGANNKWVGTVSSGLFCFSPDGQKQLYHFTTSNSPLFSNDIVSININPKTGEVYIATSKGLQSFQNIVTEGLTNFEDVYAYPNPVKPDYTGPILIHGMISGASVKITDAAGNFVYETTSEGGQAVWNGQNFKGQRVASGVYMVLCAAPDGSQKKLTKILLLN